jgi:voltage-gated potassium channel
MPTVGYGDHYPVTAAGRLVALGLMISGIALLGTVTATLAVLASRERCCGEGAAEDLQSSVRRLEAKIDRLAAQQIHDLDPTRRR